MKELPIRMGVGLIVLMALLNGCASDPFVHNMKSKSDLKPGQKVLAGRFACFENEAPVHCTKSGFFIFFNKDGEPLAKPFSPDDAGYVYVAVTEGMYDILPIFGKKREEGKDILMELDPFPVVLVRSEDSIVNFGTLEVRFYQSPGAAGSTAQSGGGGPQVRVNHLVNYDVTRSEIASRVGKMAGSINDGAVQFLARGRR